MLFKISQLEPHSYMCQCLYSSVCYVLPYTQSLVNFFTFFHLINFVFQFFLFHFSHRTIDQMCSCSFLSKTNANCFCYQTCVYLYDFCVMYILWEYCFDSLHSKQTQSVTFVYLQLHSKLSSVSKTSVWWIWFIYKYVSLSSIHCLLLLFVVFIFRKIF